MPDKLTMKIGDLAVGVRGVSYRPEHLQDDRGRDRTVLLRSTNIQGGHLRFDAIQIVPNYLVKPAQMVLEGDLVVCMSNGSKALVGKAARYRGDYGFPLTAGAFCSVFHPVRRSDSSFLCHLFQGEDFRRGIDVILSGSAINNLKNSDVEGISVVCHGSAERAKIAEILDTLDDAIIETDAVIEKLLSVRIGLAEDLLTFGISGGKPRPLSNIQEASRGPVPASWSCGTLGSISETITSGSRGWAKYYSETGAKFLRIGNLTRQHINLRLDDLIYVTPPRGQEGSRTAVQEGDLLISITADLGIIGAIPSNFGEAYVNQHISLVRLKKDEVNPRWPAHYLSSRRSQHMFQKLNDQGAKAGINLPAVGRIRVPLPPREEQDAIVERLDAADYEVARFRVERDKLAALRFGLRDDLLTGRKRVVSCREAAQ